MATKKLLVVIREDGTVEIEAVGFKGQACAKATQAIADALGKVTSSVKKPEWTQREENVQSIG